jgi:hypothetical protein
MRQFFLLFIAILTSGCIPHANVLELKPYTKLSGPNISLQTPEYNSNASWRSSGITGARDWINIWRQVPNMMSEDVSISVSVPERLKESTEKFFIKNFDFEKWGQAVLTRPDIAANMKERGVGYSKKYVDYIGGLKCGTDVESSNIALGVGSKRYYTACGYYDTTGAKKRIDIFYNYTYTHSGTKQDGDTQSSTVSPEAMQLQFKQDMKAIFDSLVIHDMDRERMAKEGLLYDRKYEIQEW